MKSKSALQVEEKIDGELIKWATHSVDNLAPITKRVAIEHPELYKKHFAPLMQHLLDIRDELLSQLINGH